MDIFKCPEVVISSCTFTNNTNQGIGNRPYSGNAGGIAIGYDESTDPNYHSNIKITNSTIEYNRADGSSDFERDASLLLRQKIFRQRGGGIAFYFGTTNNSGNVEITRCTFEGNFAKSAGGGLFITLLGINNSHSIAIRECLFAKNTAYIGAGLVTFYNPEMSSTDLLAQSVAVVNCTFIGNMGQYGGALSNVQLGYLNVLIVTNCTFMDNHGLLGAALYLQFLFTPLSFVPERRIVIKDWYIHYYIMTSITPSI